MSPWLAYCLLNFHLFALIVIFLYSGVFCSELNLSFWSTIQMSLQLYHPSWFVNYLGLSISHSQGSSYIFLKLDFLLEKRHVNTTLLSLVKKLSCWYQQNDKSVFCLLNPLLKGPSFHWIWGIFRDIIFSGKKIKTVVVICGICEIS